MKKNKFGILIPIRLSSKRLPKKALRKTNAGKPLEILIQNLSKIVNTRKDIVVCTTKNKIDDELVKYSKILKFSIFRGDTNDIINRMYLANLKYKFDFIAEVDGDDILAPNIAKLMKGEMERCNLDLLYGDWAWSDNPNNYSFSNKILKSKSFKLDKDW